MREVQLVYRDADPVGFGSYLRYGVDYTAVVPVAVFSRQDKESVREVIHDLIVHNIPFLSV